MILFTEYEKATGVIVGNHRCSTNQPFPNDTDTVAFISGSFDDAEYYVVNGEAVDRPILIGRSVDTVADGIAEIIIPNLPESVQFHVRPKHFNAWFSEAGMHLVFDRSGIYRVHVPEQMALFPYREIKLNVHASPSLVEAKKSAADEIDAVAAEIEESIASKHPTHNVKYLEKANEAQEIVRTANQGDTPDPAVYPMLNAEVGITAPTLLEVAQAVMVRRSAWKVVASKVEAERLGGKKAVRTATSQEDVETARQSAITEMTVISQI